MTVHKCQQRRGFTQLELLVVLAVSGLLAAIIIPAVQAARESSRRTECTNHLRQFGSAMHAYEGVHQAFPRVFNYGLTQAPPAWFGISSIEAVPPHAVLLPYLDQMSAFQNIVDSTSIGLSGNPIDGIYPAAQVVVPVFLCPSDRGDFGNNYRVCIGSDIRGHDHPASNGAFTGFDARRTGEFRDGLAYTAAASERVKSDLDFDTYSPEDFWKTGLLDAAPRPDTDTMIQICSSLTGPPPVGVFYPYVGFTWGLPAYDFTCYNHAVGPNSPVPDCTSAHPLNPPTSSYWNGGMNYGIHKASSRHPGGVNVLLMDGSVKFVGDSIDLSLWRALATRDGGETVSLP